MQDNLTRLNDLRADDTIQLADKQLMQSEELREYAEHIVTEKGMDLGAAAVCYMLVYPNISKKKPAKAMKAGRELKFFSGYDYIIQVSGELWDMLDAETRFNLVWHELLHLNPVYNAKKQEWQFKLRNPERALYHEIANEAGAEWQQVVQATVASLYDLDAEDEGQINLFR